MSSLDWGEETTSVSLDIMRLETMLRSRKEHLARANFREGDSLRVIVAGLHHLLQVYRDLDET